MLCVTQWEGRENWEAVWKKTVRIFNTFQEEITEGEAERGVDGGIRTAKRLQGQK